MTYLLADCARCGKTFGVRDDPAVAGDLAEVAAITGAIDFFREAECPLCGARVVIRDRRTFEIDSDAFAQLEKEWTDDEAARRERRHSDTLAVLKECPKPDGPLATLSPRTRRQARRLTP